MAMTWLGEKWSLLCLVVNINVCFKGFPRLQEFSTLIAWIWYTFSMALQVFSHVFPGIFPFIFPTTHCALCSDFTVSNSLKK